MEGLGAAGRGGVEGGWLRSLCCGVGAVRRDRRPRGRFCEEQPRFAPRSWRAGTALRRGTSLPFCRLKGAWSRLPARRQRPIAAVPLLWHPQAEQAGPASVAAAAGAVRARRRDGRGGGAVCALSAGPLQSGVGSFAALSAAGAELTVPKG